MSEAPISEHAAPVQHESALAGGYRLAAEAASLIYIAVIASIAFTTGVFYVLFPELGALSNDVFTRPRGTWARAPLLLAITPPLAGVIGIFVTRLLPYGLTSVLADVCASIALIIVMRSPVAPSISAGLLPLVLGVQSWWYPPAILFGTILLAALSIPWKRFSMERADGARTPAQVAEEAMHAAPRDYSGLVPLILFVAIATGIVELTGMRFILFPPLVVIGFEMFAHPATCPWAERSLILPIACFLSAAGGLLCLSMVGANPATAALSMAWGIAVLRSFNLHAPPVLAVALLPMVMSRPTWAYPISVGTGTLLLTLSFLLWNALPARSA
ncbi:MAG: HPP family protein [Candidatus Binataceae bacterium]